MDFHIILQALGVVWSVVVLIAAAIVMGTRRGLREGTAKLATNQTALIEVLESRLDTLTAENVRLQEQVTTLRSEVAALRAELDIEKRITHRLQAQVG